MAMQACLQALNADSNHELVHLVLSDTRMADLFVVLMESAMGDAAHLAPAVQSRSAVLAVVTTPSACYMLVILRLRQTMHVKPHHLQP